MAKHPESFLQRVESVVPLHDKLVLDIGCGDGLRTKGIAEVARHVVAIDPDATALKTARKDNHHPRVVYQHGNAVRLKFPDQSFDVVIFTMSFHHIAPKKMPRALDEALRVTKMKSYIVFLEPGWYGSLYDAQRRFDFGDGDNRDIKAYAYHAMLTEPRMKEILESVEPATYPYSSLKDFVSMENPQRGLKAEWREFLEKRRFRLRGEHRVNIFQKR